MASNVLPDLPAVLIANEMRSPAVVNGFMKLVEKDFAVR